MAKEKRVYTQEQATIWMSRVARGMQQHDQTVFLIEQLQPSWLPRRWQLMVYGLITRHVDSFCANLGAAFFVAGLFAVFNLDYLWVSVVAVLASSLFSAIPLYLVDFLLLRSRSEHPMGFNPRQAFRFIFVALRAIITAFSALVLVALFIFISDRRSGGSMASEIIIDLAYGSIFVLTPLCFGLARGNLGKLTLRSNSSDISTVERLSWSWAQAFKGMAVSLAVGVMFIIGALLIFMNSIEILAFIAPMVLMPLLLLLVPIFRSFQVSVLEEKILANAGIRTSISNALSVLWKTTLVTMFIAFGIVSSLFSRELVEALLSALSIGFGYGLLAGTWYGGADVHRHYTTRLLLSRKGYLPWDLAAFLDFSTDELHILQRVGGGYMFLHRYLLEYFAGLDDRTELKSATTPERPGAVSP